MQSFHAFDVQRLETVSPRRNEVKTAMHTVVGDIAPVQAALVLQEPLELVINIIDNLLVANDLFIYRINTQQKLKKCLT